MVMGIVIKILNRIILVSVLISYSQDKPKEEMFELSKELLNKELILYNDKFEEIRPGEYLSGLFHYKYTGEQLLFHSYPVKNLMVRCKEGIISRVYFEIDYTGDNIIYELIDYYGFPVSGNMNPKLPRYKDESKGHAQDNFLYENYSGLVWNKDDDDRYMSITNFNQNRYFTEGKPVLMVKFNLLKQ